MFDDDFDMSEKDGMTIIKFGVKGPQKRKTAPIDIDGDGRIDIQAIELKDEEEGEREGKEEIDKGLDDIKNSEEYKNLLKRFPDMKKHIDLRTKLKKVFQNLMKY